jgi:hypothetical protein
MWLKALSLASVTGGGMSASPSNIWIFMLATLYLAPAPTRQTLLRQNHPALAPWLTEMLICISFSLYDRRRDYILVLTCSSLLDFVPPLEHAHGLEWTINLSKDHTAILPLDWTCNMLSHTARWDSWCSGQLEPMSAMPPLDLEFEVVRGH